MRLLIVTSFFPPLNSIASHRPYSWAKQWSASGHDITVLTTQKTRHASTDLALPIAGFSVVEAPLPPLIQRLKQSYQAGSSPHSKASTSSSSPLHQALNWIKRSTGTFDSCHMPDLTDFWVGSALRSLKAQKPWDVVISTAPPFPVHRLADRIRKAGLARRWVMDYRDLIVDSPITQALFPFNHLETWLERRYINTADAITTVSAGLQATLQRRYPEAAIHVIENGYDPSNLATLSKEPFFPSDGIFRMAYLGYIYPGKRDPGPLFQTIKELAQDPCHRTLLDRLEVLFYGPEMGDVPKLVEAYGVAPWVTLGGFVSHSDALRIQRDVNALLFLSWTDTEVDGMLTGKLFEYLSANTPIVALGAAKPAVSEHLITEAQAGLVLGRDVPSIKRYLVDQLSQPIKKASNVDTEVLSRYTRQGLADKLLSVISDLS